MALDSNSTARKSLRVWLPAIRAGSGADVFTLRLAEALRRAGHVPLLQWFDHRYELLPDLLKKVPAPTAIDVVQANSWQGFAFKREGTPLVVTEHHYVLDPAFRQFKSIAQHLYHRGLIDGYMRRTFAVADAVVVDSVFTAKVLRDQAKLTVSRTIPLWADYDLFSPISQQPAGCETEVFRLLFVGNASKRKGADVIPLLAERLGTRFEIRCTAGLRAGGDVNDLENVIPLGRLSVQDLVREYRYCDAVLVPSRYEGFGYAALEAMACAKPVIGFRCGAVEEVVVDRETGLLFDIDDIDVMVDGCRTLASNRPLVRKLGAAGRERAVTHFSEKAGMDAYVELYMSIAAA